MGVSPRVYAQSVERTDWGPSGVTRLTVNICAGAARGAATREAASLETPENARVEEARMYSICDVGRSESAWEIEVCDQSSRTLPLG